MGPKTKTNTYKFTEFSLVLTIAYLAIKVSDTKSVTEWIYSPFSKTVFQSCFAFVINSQTSALITKTGQQYVCNLVLFQMAVWHCSMYSFLPVEALAQLYPLAWSLWQVTCIPWDFRAISAKCGSLYACFDRSGAFAATLDPFSVLLYNLGNVAVVMRCPKYWDTLCKARCKMINFECLAID